MTQYYTQPLLGCELYRKSPRGNTMLKLRYNGHRQDTYRQLPSIRTDPSSSSAKQAKSALHPHLPPPRKKRTLPDIPRLAQYLNLIAKIPPGKAHHKATHHAHNFRKHPPSQADVGLQPDIRAVDASQVGISVPMDYRFA